MRVGGATAAEIATLRRQLLLLPAVLAVKGEVLAVVEGAIATWEPPRIH